ncbi:hypothetical protein SAMN05421767_10610 [Granulicatella balaenopterae]|uniref:Uncharacterized protein n=1 Tax=Granulicatella balaenopterae TaxID=137733 RepID=A0A1H9IK33_9LACT|nr:pyocin knob domain-containing protein [Granulicatella balaenopterae]SEQ74889.1 hypothetical protein SAMN05421767_10610 [Granulicatella balaenopterae]
MTYFIQPVITTAGASNISAAIANKQTITFTRFSLGDGRIKTNIENAKDVANEIYTIAATAATQTLEDTESPTFRILGRLDNTEIDTELTINEIGIFAKVGNGAEFMYMYTWAENGDVIPPNNAGNVYRDYDFATTIDKNAKVTIKFENPEQIYSTHSELLAFEDATNKKIDKKIDNIIEVEKAKKLSNARTIELSGKATGKTFFDGSKDVSINVDIKTATTNDTGLVQLDDNVNSTNVIKAATGHAVGVVNKAFSAHQSDNNKHITSSERTKWNGKADLNYTQTELNKKADKSVAQMHKLTQNSGKTLNTKGVDIDTLKLTQFREIQPGTLGTLPNNIRWGLLLVISGEGNDCAQFAMDNFNNNACYTRVMTNNVWGNWKILATTIDLGKKADIAKAQMYKLTRDNGDMKILKDADINNVYENGFYYVWNGGNLPAHRLGWLLVFTRDNSKLTTQIYIDYYEENMFYRIGKEHGWTNWVELATTSDLTATETKLQKAIDLKSSKTYVDNVDNTIKQSIADLDSRVTANLNKKADKSVAQMYKLTADNGITKTTTDKNIDNYKSTGLYYITGVQINGKSYNGYLEIAKLSSKWCKQVFTTHIDNLIFTRVFCDARYWTSWQKLATTEYVWGKPILNNGWQNYGGEFGDFQFSKDDTGLVVLKGNIKHTSTMLPGGTIATLPKHVAPKSPMYFTVITGDFEIGIICIQPSGEITKRGKINTQWLCFDGISYKI